MSKDYPIPTVIASEHEDLMKKIGQKIKDLRKAKGLSYPAMADEIGISKNNYYMMENGTIYFKFSTFLKVLEYHQIDVKDFLGIMRLVCQYLL